MLYVQQGKLKVNLKFNALFAFVIPSLRMKKKKKQIMYIQQRIRDARGFDDVSINRFKCQPSQELDFRLNSKNN